MTVPEREIGGGGGLRGAEQQVGERRTGPDVFTFFLFSFFFFFSSS